MNIRTATALAVIASLGKMPAHADIAAKMSHEDALRVHSRWQRRMWNTGPEMTLVQLVAMSTKRARQRNTHPHKRGKR